MPQLSYKACIIVVAIFTILNMSSVCFAQDAGKKLGRGIVNMLTGWVELPKNIYETSSESNLLAGFTVGLVKGLGMTVVRTGAGVYDTATFPFALPEDYKPVLEPEYVLDKNEQNKAKTETIQEPR